MNLKDSFSWCPMGQMSESKHQLHWHKNYEPYNDEVEIWLLGKLYSSVLIEPGVDGLSRSVDYGRGEQKKNQVWEFLDYHSSRYNGSRLGFNADVRLVLALLKSNPDIKSIPRSQIESVNSFIEVWINRKVEIEPPTIQRQPRTPSSELVPPAKSQPTPNPEQKREQINCHLKLLFKVEKEFDEVMQELISRTKIHENTYKWKNEKSGYKTLCCALIKDIEGKGYLRDEIKMNAELCKAIAKQTFGLEIGLRIYYDAELAANEKGIIPQRKTSKESD